MRNFEIRSKNFLRSPFIALKINPTWSNGFFLNFQREVLKASGYHNTIGNRMKQKKLYEEFPAVDSSVLDEIFQANWFVNIFPKLLLYTC